MNTSNLLQTACESCSAVELKSAVELNTVWGVLLFLLLAVLLYLYYHERKKSYYLRNIQQSLSDRLYEQQEIMQIMARMGKMSFFSSSTDNVLPSGNTTLPKSYMQNLLPQEQERFSKSCQKLFSGQTNCIDDSFLLKINGKLRRHQFAARIITLPNSRQKKFMHIAMDTSELEANHREMADADLLLKAIFENMPGHIFIKNISSDFSYVKCNNTYSSLLSMTPDDLIGKNDFDLFDRALAQRIRHVDMELARTGLTADNRWFFTTPDQTEHAIRFISKPVTRLDGTQWILGVGLDVTRQEQISSKLRRRNRDLRLLMSQFEYTAMLLDTDLNMQAATPSMHEYLKTMGEQSPETFRNCSRLFCHQATPPEDCAARTALTGNYCCCCDKLPNPDKKLRIKPIIGEDNSVINLLLTMIDANASLPNQPEEKC